MNGRLRALIAAVSVVLGFLVWGAGPADAAPERITAPATGLNAPVVYVEAPAGDLGVRDNLHVVYAWKHGDPPCDASGSTVYAGHAWRAGNGVADHWGRFKPGDRIRVGGCAFKVTHKEYWGADRGIGPLSSQTGPPRIALITCKADDYSKRTVVFARKVGSNAPKHWRHSRAEEPPRGGRSP